jgi:anaerobic selenocysteine-containing dehydrogenase
MAHTVFHTCTLCEATCGLAFEVESDRVLSVRPDREDVFSRGFVCPKGIAIADVHHDPDRLRTPVRRTTAGDFEPISWEDAFGIVAGRLMEVRARHGKDAVAFYWGNPTGNNHGALLLLNAFSKALGTRNRYSAGSQDANPRLVTSFYLYGASIAVPIPDVDRTDYFLCLGANPVVSNGSALTAPDMRGRLRAIRARGGKIVVVDPRRTETAAEADEHVPIRPGGDAALLLAMVRVLAEQGRVAREFVEASTSGWPEIERRLAEFTPVRAAALAGVAPETITRLALEFADAKAPVAYSRVGVCVAQHATLATYATDLLNIVTGRLGREGGPMFPTPAFDLGGIARRTGLDGHDRWRSRVRQLPETAGDLPSATLADEIETPGPGQVRAFVTLAGNPVLSVPNGRRLSRALSTLDFMVSIDIYVNETTRHADVILPPCWSLAEDHLDLLFSGLAVRNIARWSPPVVGKGPGERADWESLAVLGVRRGGGPTGTPLLDRLLRLGRPLGWRFEPTAVADLLLRTGPYGDRFLPFLWRSGLNMARLRAAPHGIDLGPMQPGFERRVFHDDRRIHLAPPPIVAAMDALGRVLAAPAATANGHELLLIGRREQRSNNSWMHNVPALVSGKARCVLLVHPEDAARRGLHDGDLAALESRVHRGTVSVSLTTDMRPGVVSLPHGWGHAASAPWQDVAGKHPGVSANDWTDDAIVEPVVGQSILNGVPVRLERATERDVALHQRGPIGGGS